MTVSHLDRIPLSFISWGVFQILPNRFRSPLGVHLGGGPSFVHSNSSVLLTSLPRAVIDHEAERASLARIQRQLYIILFTCETFSMDEAGTQWPCSWLF